MRTDAKVGLICALVLVIAVIAYFAIPRNNTSAKSPTEGVPLANTPPTPPSDVPPAPAPAPAYASDSTLFIAPPSTGPAPAGPLVVTPPGAATRSLIPLPATNPALTGGAPATPTTPYTPSTPPYTPPLDSNAGGPGRSSTEIPSSERPHDDTSLLERTSPRPTIGESSTSSNSAGTYKIQKGDLLTTIAKKYNTTVKALEAANPKINPNNLKINSVINLPAAGSSASTPPASPTTRPAHHAGTASTPAPSTGAATSYTVKKGDYLRKIAKSVYGDEAQWKRIFRANRDQLDSPDDIDPGMVLKIPSK